MIYRIHAEIVDHNGNKLSGFSFLVNASSAQEARDLVLDREWLKPEERMVRISGGA